MEGEFPTINISDEGRIETPTPVLPVAPKTAAPARIVRTFESDLARVMRDKKGSVIKIAMAEHKRRADEIEFKEKVPKKNIILLFFTLLSVAGGLAFLGFVFINKKTNEISISETKIVPIIFSEKQKDSDITGFSKTKLINKMGELLADTSLRLDTIENVPLLETVGGGSVPISTERFFSLLGTRIPPVLLRSFDSKFMLGIHAFNGNKPFIILKTDFYENAFLGFLKWEKDIPEDLLPFLGIQITGENRYLLDADFEDTIIKNKDARMLKRQDGEPILIYVIPNKETIIITTAEDTLNEVLRRLNAPAGTIK